MYRNVFKFPNKKIEKKQNKNSSQMGPWCAQPSWSRARLFFSPYIIFSLVTGIQLVCLLSLKSISSALRSVYNKGFFATNKKS